MKLKASIRSAHL